MPIGGVEMLRKLGSGIRPDARTQRASKRPVESLSFADLVAQARSGHVETGEPLTLGAGVEASVDDDELARLAVAVDAATAAGAERLLALSNGRSLTIDIQERLVESVETEAAGRLEVGVDAVVVMPDDPEADLRALFAHDDEAERTRRSSAGAELGGSWIRNVSLAHVLAADGARETGQGARGGAAGG